MVAAHYQIDYLGIRVPDEFLSRHRRIRDGSAGVQQAQEIVDLGYGADGRTRVAAGGLLLDGDHRAETADALHRRLLENAHEMLGIGRERVHVAPLPLGVYGVEGERRLAAAADSRDHGEPAPRNIDVHTLEIVGVRTAYFYILLLVHVQRGTNLPKNCISLSFVCGFGLPFFQRFSWDRTT